MIKEGYFELSDITGSKSNNMEVTYFLVSKDSTPLVIDLITDTLFNLIEEAYRIGHKACPVTVENKNAPEMDKDEHLKKYCHYLCLNCTLETKSNKITKVKI